MSGVDWSCPQCVENSMHLTAIRVLILVHSAQMESVPGYRVSTSTTCYLIKMLRNVGLKDTNLDGTVCAGSFLSSWHKLGNLKCNLTLRVSPSAWPLGMWVKHFTAVIWWRKPQVTVGIVTPGKVGLCSVSKVTEQIGVWCQVSNSVPPSSLPQSPNPGLQVYMLCTWFPLMTVCNL